MATFTTRCRTLGCTAPVGASGKDGYCYHHAEDSGVSRVEDRAGRRRSRHLGPVVITVTADECGRWAALGLPRPSSDHHSARADVRIDRKGRPHVDATYFRYFGFADGGPAREIAQEQVAALRAVIAAEETPDDVAAGAAPDERAGGISQQEIESVRTALADWAASSRPERDAAARQIIQATRKDFVALADTLDELRAALEAIFPAGSPAHWGLY